jgi:hypothetical protein
MTLGESSIVRRATEPRYMAIPWDPNQMVHLLVPKDQYPDRPDSVSVHLLRHPSLDEVELCKNVKVIAYWKVESMTASDVSVRYGWRRVCQRCMRSPVWKELCSQWRSEHESNDQGKGEEPGSSETAG